MYGAILGDIAGSRFEFTRPEHFDWRHVELFTGMSKYTDDTVLTVAMGQCLKTGFMPIPSGAIKVLATVRPCA